MPRDGTENLIPVTERTKKEAREISRKGGIASGKARREKADLKKKVNEILSMDVFSPQLKETLEEKGLSATNQTAVVTVLLQKALKGDMRAIELLAKMNGNEGTKDSLDKKEQKERVKAMQLENKKREQQLEGGVASEDNISKIKAEIDAQNYLLSVEKRYNIPRNESEQTKKNLKYWREKLKKYED